MIKLGVIATGVTAAILGMVLGVAPAHAGGLTLPPTATQGLNLLYAGQSEKAVEVFQQIQTSHPDSPLGYLLEAEARWWQIYCEACEIKWNMIDAWHLPHRKEDDGYLTLTEKARQLAEARLAQGASAEMEFYDGMSWLLRARLLGLRDDHRGTAHAGVETRAHLLRSLELDPKMVDAYAGLGLYDYYVDTLSVFAKVMRLFMGIPGGTKQEGVRKLRIAMTQGTLTRVEARFYLSKNLRNYDHDYESSLEVMQPLIAEFPQNPIFQLIFGDTQAKLARRELAAASFHAAESIAVPNRACAQRIREVAAQSLALLAKTGR